MTARRISYQDVETWRSLVVLAGDVIEDPTPQRVRRMQRQADQARKARFPVDDAEARITFSPLLRLIAKYTEADRPEMAALVDTCRIAVFPREDRKDVHG